MNHSIGQYVMGNNTTNRIEGVFAHFKRMVNGIHHYLSHFHIQKYTNMFCFRWNTMNCGESERIELLLMNMNNTKITYKEVVHGGQEG